MCGAAKHPVDEAFPRCWSRACNSTTNRPSPHWPEAVGSHTLHLTLGEGKYHQVKRMVAAAGNRVEALKRIAIGRLTLPDDLPEGQWRWLTESDLEKLRR